MMADGNRKRVCFVTGTRADFGLMRSALLAIKSHRRLDLQIVATGMHLSPQHGRTVRQIRKEGWHVDRVAPWNPRENAPADVARSTGSAMAGIATALDELQSDVVLVVGDRVEAFAAAAAGHLSGRVVAHVHGGDRAAGQVDDALRHAITKLSHIHFPATVQSADRIAKLGEEAWRIHRVGSPGIDGIKSVAAPRRDVSAEIGQLDWGRYALVLLHPVDPVAEVERERAKIVVNAMRSVPFSQRIIIYPNNDPGSRGIIEAWKRLKPSARDVQFIVRPDVARPVFLGLLRDAAVLIGNSSSGIIEAASFRTPVIDIGPRQKGREHGTNVVHVPYNGPAIRRALRAIWNDGRPLPIGKANVYASGGAGKKIAAALAGLTINDRLLRKLIAY